jgi:hypothetical protein
MELGTIKGAVEMRPVKSALFLGKAARESDQEVLIAHV